MSFWTFLGFAFMIFCFGGASWALYGEGGYSDKGIRRKFWQQWGDLSPEAGFFEYALLCIWMIPLLLTLEFFGVLVMNIFFGGPSNREGSWSFDYAFIFPFVVVCVLAFTPFAAAILAAYERRDAGYGKKKDSARDKVRMAFEFESHGRFEKTAIQREVAEKFENYLERATAIETAFRNTQSPIFDEGKCGDLARFAKRHLKGMKEVKDNKVERIVELLYAYHRYEWDVLKLAREYTPPEPETAIVPIEEPEEVGPTISWRRSKKLAECRERLAEIGDIVEMGKECELMKKQHPEMAEQIDELIADILAGDL